MIDLIGKDKETGSKAVKQLYYNWLAFWLFMFLLYMVLFAEANFPTVPTAVWRVASVALDVTTSFFLLVCYLVLSKITVASDATLHVLGTSHPTYALYPLWVGIVLAISAGEYFTTSAPVMIRTFTGMCS